MTIALSKIANDYAFFETAVRQQIAAICMPHCSLCQRVCCGVEYCRENIDSPFLRIIGAQNRLENTFCAKRGWLTPAGCGLPNGRPPVCYQFNCDKIMDALPDDLSRYLIRVLSNLIPHIGKRALGNRHLVEIMDPARLNKVKPERFGRRLAEAQAALQAIRSYNRHGFLAVSSLPLLSKIMPPPDHLTDNRTLR